MGAVVIKKMKYLKNLNKEKSNGFTIVETMIVLAIAGLILLIVLLAVPALQRQSNNSNMKSDAEAISSAIGNFESNNGGYVPSTANFTSVSNANTNGVVSIGNGASGATTYIASTAKVQSSDVVVVASGSFTPPTTTGTSDIYIQIGYTCSKTNDPRGISIYYPIQTSSGDQYSSNNCIDA